MNCHRMMRTFPAFFLLTALILLGGRLSAEQIETYRSADGVTYFALPLTAPAPPEAGPVDVALAVDLSAGQLSAQVRAGSLPFPLRRNLKRRLRNWLKRLPSAWKRKPRSGQWT